MRKIENFSGGEVVDVFFVFETEEEREEYFKRADKRINESQTKSLADLRFAYMSNTVKAQKVRSVKGKAQAKMVFASINDTYMSQVKKTHELYAQARANLRRSRETSLLESDLAPEKTE